MAAISFKEPQSEGQTLGKTSPACFTKVATPHDSNDEAFCFKGFYVGGTGNITLVNMDGTTTLFTAIPVGTQFHVCGRRINSTNTTATLIVLYF